MHSPACPLCTLTPLQLGQSGDIALCPSWGRAQGILAQLCASSWGSVTHTWGSIGRLDIPHPQQTSLRGQGSHGRDIHHLLGDMQGTVCIPPRFYWGHWGEARLRGGGVSLPLVQSMCCRRRGQDSGSGEMDVPCPPWI